MGEADLSQRLNLINANIIFNGDRIMKKLDVWKFAIQVVFSAVVLALCVSKLAVDNLEAPDKSLYWGGLSGVLAYWLPSPGNNLKGDEQSEKG